MRARAHQGWLVAVALLAAGFLATGCGDDGGDGDDAQQQAVATDGEGCAGDAELSAPTTAGDQFPDNPDVEWQVTLVRADEAGRQLVELLPAPDEVGHPAFLLAFTCDGDDAVHVGTYGLEGDVYVLLSTTDALTGELAPQLDA
jgi:hypothetical protein